MCTVDSVAVKESIKWQKECEENAANSSTGDLPAAFKTIHQAAQSHFPSSVHENMATEKFQYDIAKSSKRAAPPCS